MAVLAQAGKDMTQDKVESLEERQLRLQQRRDQLVAAKKAQDMA